MRSRSSRQSSTCQRRLVGLGARRPSAAACRVGARRSGRRGRPRAGCWRSASALGVPGSSSSGRRRLADVLGQRCQPGLVEVLLDHLHERPHRAFGQPGVGLGVGARGQGQGAGDQRPGKREADVGAHPVVRSGRDAESGRQALGEPALDALGRHRDDLGRHRVVERLGHQLGQHRHQGVGAIGAVDVQHPGRVRRRCSGAGSAKPPARKAGCAATPCRCWRRPRAAPRWSIAPTSSSSGRAAYGLQVARRRLDRRELVDLAGLASPRRRGRGTCGR